MHDLTPTAASHVHHHSGPRIPAPCHSYCSVPLAPSPRATYAHRPHALQRPNTHQRHSLRTTVLSAHQLHALRTARHNTTAHAFYPVYECVHEGVSVYVVYTSTRRVSVHTLRVHCGCPCTHVPLVYVSRDEWVHVWQQMCEQLLTHQLVTNRPRVCLGFNQRTAPAPPLRTHLRTPLTQARSRHPIGSPAPAVHATPSCHPS